MSYKMTNDKNKYSNPNEPIQKPTGLGKNLVGALAGGALTLGSYFVERVMGPNSAQFDKLVSAGFNPSTLDNALGCVMVFGAVATGYNLYKVGQKLVGLSKWERQLNDYNARVARQRRNHYQSDEYKEQFNSSNLKM